MDLLVDMTKVELTEDGGLRCPCCGKSFRELVVRTDTPLPMCASCAQKVRRPRRESDAVQLELV